MIYTIAYLKQTCIEDPQMLEIGKEGNRYFVSLGSSEGHATRVFESRTEAYKVFEKLSGWLVFHYYTKAARLEYLKTGTMP